MCSQGLNLFDTILLHLNLFNNYFVGCAQLVSVSKNSIVVGTTEPICLVYREPFAIAC